MLTASPQSTGKSKTSNLALPINTGGAYTYAEAMEVVDTMHITHVHDAPEDADAFFPAIDPEIWREDSRSELQVDPATGITYEFVVYRRR